MFLFFLWLVKGCVYCSDECDIKNPTCVIGKNVRSLHVEETCKLSVTLEDSELVIHAVRNTVIDLVMYNTTVTLIDDDVLITSVLGFDYSSNYITSDSRSCHAYINGKCVLCDSILVGGHCINPSPVGCSIYNDRCIQCSQGYYLEGGVCFKCPPNCRYCNRTDCILCGNGYHGSDCESYSNSIQDKLVLCENASFQDTECIDSELCMVTTQIGCVRCAGSVLINGSCIPDDRIEESTKNNLVCSRGFFLSNESCLPCSKYGNCAECNEFTCYECINSYLNSSGYCANQPVSEPDLFIPEHCDANNSNTCLRCETGYYWNGTQCNPCSSNCISCINEMECIKCVDSAYLESGVCFDRNADLASRCENFIVGRENMCAVCKTGYYMKDGACYKCNSGCHKCNLKTCIECEESNFLYNSSCYPYSELTNCVTPSKSGCEQCEKGYRLLNGLCYECEYRCTECDNFHCYNCEEDYLLVNNSCLYYTDLPNCLGAENGECNKCTLFHYDTDCSFKITWWLCLIISIVVLAILSLILLMASLIARFINKETPAVTIFNSKHTNIKFETDSVLMYNVKELDFGVDLPIDSVQETKLCIGNATYNSIKLQFCAVSSHKYDLSIIPNAISLPKGMVCEFTACLIPRCSCIIQDTVRLSVLEKDRHLTYDFPIRFDTILTTKLDMDEIEIQTKLGEGSFGVVYSGVFRNMKVAIKKSKITARDDEFINEISMLDKFRCDYIVHYYGYVDSCKTRMLVTELAPFGNANSVIGEDMPESIRLKIVSDSAKGIQYLHTNGILHRDIKPDNILLFDIQNSDDHIVNAKLTDFGTSRNINLIMTNMSFTRGIGTPKYMAPELLNKQHYKKPADIYSFAVTMYELFSNRHAYEKKDFKYEWNIATFVQSGKRLDVSVIGNTAIRSLVSVSWKQDPLDRPSIDEIVDILSKNDL